MVKVLTQLAGIDVPVIVIAIAIYSIFQSRRRAIHAERLQELDELQAKYWLAWYSYAKRYKMSSNTNIFDINQPDPFEDYEWSCLESDEKHQKLYYQWVDAKIAVCKHEPGLVRENFGQLVVILNRVSPEYQQKIMSLICLG